MRLCTAATVAIPRNYPIRRALTPGIWDGTTTRVPAVSRCSDERAEGVREMSVDLNHIIVHAAEPRASAQFLAEILDLPVRPAWGPFLPVQTANAVTLDFMRDEGAFTEQHCAFLVDDDAFDTGLRRLHELCACIWADPWRRRPDEINRLHGGRGLYFDDPDGHLMELITAPYGDTPTR
jgi:hypothetical protein